MSEQTIPQTVDDSELNTEELENVDGGCCCNPRPSNSNCVDAAFEANP
jgi:hypothetical protein